MSKEVTKDWHQWHRHYDTPDSPLAQRLELVRRDLRRALAEGPRDADGVLRLTSICAGEGRDVLPVLAEQGGGNGVKALLIELDPIMAERARTAAADLELSGVEVRIADAGTTDTYLGLPSAHVLLACGVFGNIDAADMRRTVAALPPLLAADGIVIWTRSGRSAADDPSLDVRDCFLNGGFTEMSFSMTADDMFRVGMYRHAAGVTGVRPPRPGTRLFTFVR